MENIKRDTNLIGRDALKGCARCIQSCHAIIASAYFLHSAHFKVKDVIVSVRKNVIIEKYKEVNACELYFDA